MTLAFAVIPHEWITFSDKYLQWDTTQFVFRSGQDVFGLGIVNWPFNFDKHNIRDIIVVVIYGLGMGLNVAPVRRCGRSAARRRSAGRGGAEEVALRPPAASPGRARARAPRARRNGGDA